MKKLSYWALLSAVVLLGFVLISCEGRKLPFDIPETIIPSDTIVPPDTCPVVPPDTVSIVPTDTIAIINDTLILGTGHGMASIEFGCKENPDGIEIGLPLSVITVVKFFNPGYENKLMVQQPCMRINDDYRYDNQADFYLNINLQGTSNSEGVSQTIAMWADKELHISGSVPYIPLVNGYYLIDWKWHQLMPLCTFESATPDAYHDYFAEHINHVYVTNIDWKDLKDVTMKYDMNLYKQPIKGLEIIRVWPMVLSCLYNIGNDEYGCYNHSIFHEGGMSLDNAYMYYKYGDCSSNGRTYHSYVTYCDSIQSIYQQILIELITNGKIKEIGF